MITLDCHGTFRLVSDCGLDLTPAPEKAKGVIALLAFAKNNERRRSWLQDKLWSSKSESRSAQSLRQALSEIRKALGPFAHLLEADRRRVALSGVSVRPAPSDAQAMDFMSTVQIDDPEFHNWILVEANNHHAPAPDDTTQQAAYPEPMANVDMRITIHARPDPDPAGEFVRRTLESQILQSLQEVMPIEICDPGAMSGEGRAGDIELEVESLISGNTTTLRVIWKRKREQQRLWSNARSLDAEGGPVFQGVGFQKLSFDAVEALRSKSRQIWTSPTPFIAADFLCQQAVERVFRMTPDSLVEADRLLAQANDIAPRGLYAAWRGFLRMMQIIERHPVDFQDAAEEAIAFARHAMQEERHNSYVGALAASVLLTLGNAQESSAQIAQDAVEMNPANPLAWDALSTAAIYNSQPLKAHRYATRAQRIGGVGATKAWLDMACCLTSVVTHNYSLAKEYARSSHILCPEFRPPLRYLLALAAHEGNQEEGRRFHAKLQEQENDFCFERLATDFDYPLAAFRKSGISLDPLFF